MRRDDCSKPEKRTVSSTTMVTGAASPDDILPPETTRLSLPETSSGWRANANRAMFVPDDHGQLRDQHDSCQNRKLLVAKSKSWHHQACWRPSMTARQDTSSPGSRSKMRRSGFSRFETVEPQGWISSTPAWTKSIKPSTLSSVSIFSFSPTSTRRTAAPRPCQACLAKKHFSLTPGQPYRLLSALDEGRLHSSELQPQTGHPLRIPPAYGGRLRSAFGKSAGEPGDNCGGIVRRTVQDFNAPTCITDRGLWYYSSGSIVVRGS
jgi:hypothetical protein